MTHRRRYATVVLLVTTGTAFLVSLALMWFLDPPWSFLGIPIAAAIGWWSGGRVLAPVLRVGRESHRSDGD